MKKREANFQTNTLNSWLRNVYKKNCVFETKYSVNDRISFKVLAEHQRDWLLTAKHGIALYKIPDAGFTNPFDGFLLTETDAFVIVKFKVSPDFFLIDIDDWIYLSTQHRTLGVDLARQWAKVTSYKICPECQTEVLLSEKCGHKKTPQ